MHVGEPGCSAVVPSGHCEHEDDAYADEEPTGHGVHAEEALALYVPAGQPVSHDSAPVTALKVPPIHGTHAAWLGSL